MRLIDHIPKVLPFVFGELRDKEQSLNKSIFIFCVYSSSITLAWERYSLYPYFDLSCIHHYLEFGFSIFLKKYRFQLSRTNWIIHNSNSHWESEIVRVVEWFSSYGKWKQPNVSSIRDLKICFWFMKFEFENPLYCPSLQFLSFSL